MKKIAIIAAMMLVAAASFAQDGKSIYSKYSDRENVSAVYISPAMFKMIGKIPDIQLSDGEMNLSPLIKSLNGLYLLDSSNPEINAGLKADILKFVQNGRYELLMEAKEDGELVNIYTLNEGEYVNGFVFIAFDGEECTFISIDGKMLQSELQALIGQALQDGVSENN